MSIYKTKYIDDLYERVNSENHSSDEFNRCTNEIINLLVKYKMNFEETCAVFDMIKDRLDVSQVPIEAIMNYRKY